METKALYQKDSKFKRPHNLTASKQRSKGRNCKGQNFDSSGILLVVFTASFICFSIFLGVY